MRTSKCKTIIGILLATWALMPGLAAPPAALAAGTLVVDDNFGSGGACSGAGFANIQAAVNTLSSGQGATIKVCAGTYPGQVTMTSLGKVKLLGLPGATLTAAPPVITATGSDVLTIQGFTFNVGAGAVGSNEVSVTDTSLVFTKNTLDNSIDFYGLRVFNNTGTHTLKVTNNIMTDVGGPVNVTVNGGKLTTTITGNEFLGTGIAVALTYNGTTGGITVSNNDLEGSDGGIYLAGASKARLTGNDIEGFGNGIILSGSNHATISKNVVHTNAASAGTGITISADAGTSGANKVTGNTIQVNASLTTGIAVVGSGAGTANNDNQITSNTITDAAGIFNNETGIKLFAGGGVINGTLIKSNKLINIAAPFFFMGDTETVGKSNKCTPVSPCFP